MSAQLDKTHLEANLEGFFRKRVRLLGGYTIKLAPTEAGVPDRLVVFPGGRMYLVELKRSDTDLSPIQKVWHERMATNYNVVVHVLYGQEGVIAWLRRIVATAELASAPRRGRPRKVG